VYFKSSSIAITQMKNGFRSSLILALNVTREVAQDRKFSRTSQLNSRPYPHQADFHRQNHTDFAPRQLPWQTSIPSIPEKGAVLAVRNCRNKGHLQNKNGVQYSGAQSQLGGKADTLQLARGTLGYFGHEQYLSGHLEIR
jgi:hypothetical protein